jgi:7,8-dihydropterin-6-yl-methyl-4-(beta-D-ribofuranosyl)aminobenzene 5'-phosphate synthase
MQKLILITILLVLTSVVCDSTLGAEKPYDKQSKHITIIVLYDNYVYSKNLKSDWGFSCVVMGTEKNILFDMGARSYLLLSNIEKLGIKPKDIEVVVLSHNHRDHIGGLLSFLDKNSDVLVFYLPPSCPDAFVQKVKQAGDKVDAVHAPVKICEGVYLTGPMGETIEEQSMILDTAKGAVVITGYSHPGIVSIARKAKEMLTENLYLIFGGFHLLSKSDAEIKDTITKLNNLGVLKIGPTHCTGEKAIKLFKEAYGSNFIQMDVGRVLEIPKRSRHDKCSEP